MIDFLYQILILKQQYVLGTIFSELVLAIICVTWIKSYGKKYSQVQKIHVKETSRLGGSIILCSIFIPIFFFDYPILALTTNYFLLFTPIAVVTIFEDLHLHLNPIIRLAAMFFSCFLLLFVLDFKLPDFDIVYLDLILNNSNFKIMVFIFFIIAMMNGANFIDGANGLLFISFLTSMVALMFISFKVNDLILCQQLAMIAIPFLIILLINYPFGLIFLGDLGAYLSGWILGIFSLILFSNHPELTTWSVILICFYPLAEVIFSVIRKVYNRKSPFLPDELHLHLKLFFFLKKSLKNQAKVANNLIMPFLTFFWFAPPTIGVMTIKNINMTLCSILFFSVMYLLFYKFIPKSVKS